jgi:ribosomal protein L16 Arg81 hydroxylase
MHRFQSALTDAGFARGIEECWETRPLYLGKVFANSLSNEFGQGAIEGVIARSHDLLTRTEVIRDGQRIQWNVPGSPCYGRVDAIPAALEAGLTVLVRRFDHDHEATAALARALMILVGQPVFATLFMTHRLGDTFPAHYDAANVVAVQLCGVKRWRLFERVNPPPASDAEVRPVQTELREPTHCEDLACGDLLYVPRGTIHRVAAISCPSLHISLGVRAATRRL